MRAQYTVPRGMLHSVFWSLVFGFFMAASFVLAMPDLAASAQGRLQLPGSTCSPRSPMPSDSAVICSPSASSSRTTSARWPA